VPGSKFVGSGGVNKPLPFALKNLNLGHPYLLSRVAPATIKTFGLGFFTGKGSMAGRVVIPIHNATGELVAYAGRSACKRYQIFFLSCKACNPLQPQTKTDNALIPHSAFDYLSSELNLT